MVYRTNQARIVVSAASPWGALSIARDLVRNGFTMQGRLRRTKWRGLWVAILVGPKRTGTPAVLWTRRIAA